MIALSCVILVLCVLLLMINLGVGPFVNPPWLRLHLAFTKLPPMIKLLLTLLPAAGALACSLIIMGFVL